jgi:mono/diheme cytochrome c family protein
MERRENSRPQTCLRDCPPAVWNEGASMLRRLFIFLCLLCACRAEEKFGPYAEPDFPVLTSTVDFSDWEKLGFPKNNVAVRGLIIKLPHDLYVCFDQDLLRVAGIWQGEPGGKFLTYTTIPAISYNVESRKSEPGQKALPKPIGKPLMGTGLMPGWILKAAREVKPEDLVDPRTPGPDPTEPGRGPLPEFRWGGYVFLRPRIVLMYEHSGVEISEEFDSALVDGRPVVSRSIHVIEKAKNAAENMAVLIGPAGQNVTEPTAVVEGTGWGTLPGGGAWKLCYTTPGQTVIDPGPKRESSPSIVTPLPPAGPAVPAGIRPAHDTGAFLVEEISLPVPNQWKRNVRPSGIAFFRDGSAAVCTIDGDVWIVSGLTKAEPGVTWRRYASGLHEPQSLVIRGEQVFVFTRDGIVQLEAPPGQPAQGYYNFCNAFTQTGETREYPMDMVAKPGGGFYIAKGGQMVTRKTPQGGHVLEVSADGKTVTDICSGLRQPYLGIHPGTGLLTASDQQGHWTVSTPIRYIRKGAYYGFEEASPNPIPSLIDQPACWIPHEVNQSAAGQVWAVDAKMGPLNDRLLHLMYFRPGILTAFLDPDQKQGAVVPTGLPFDFPLLKGAINPVDGLLYVCGFRIWGTESKSMAGLARVRPTGKPSGIPTTVRAVPQGIHLRFAEKLDAASLKPEHFAVSRWNYKRTSGYGSAHYKLDGTPGMELLPCTGVQVSTDGFGLLVHLPDMRPAEQYRLDWRLASAAGAPINSFTTLTLYALTPFDAAAAGFDASFKPAARPVMAAAAQEEPTMEAGKQLITTLGCLACHSTDGKMEGMKGPTWKDLFGSQNELVNGKSITADAAYLRESILKPAASVRKGFNNPDVGMPPYEGILSDSQVESILLYLRSLSSR